MDSEHDWAIFYKFEGDLPTEFYEVRRFGKNVWVANGRPNTFGESSSSEYPTSEATVDAFQAACAEAEKNGFVRTHSGAYGRKGIDVAQLTNAIYEGAKRAFAATRQAHPDQTLTHFGLYSDESAMTIGWAANSKEAIAESDEDEEFQWNLSCWPFSEGDEHLDPAYRMILPRCRDIPCDADDDFEKVRDLIFDACVSALARLREEGIFERPINDLIVLFQVSDSEIGIELNKRLNTPKNYKRYKSALGM